jgi:hypothetical protein
MTKEDIIRWAREAKLGNNLSHHGGEIRVWIEGADWHDELERFAALAYAAGVAAGAAAEREACVEACQNCVMYGPVIEAQQRYNQAYWHCVEAIRARGKK